MKHFTQPVIEFFNTQPHRPLADMDRVVTRITSCISRGYETSLRFDVSIVYGASVGKQMDITASVLSTFSRKGPSRGQRLDYDNLAYACNLCNSMRREVSLPMNPSTEPPAHHLHISTEGIVRAITPEGADLIELCRLNRALLVAARQRILNLITLLRDSNDQRAIVALQDMLAFPSDLPNLAALRPPDGNVRPEGIAESFFERQRRGELVQVY